MKNMCVDNDYVKSIRELFVVLILSVFRRQEGTEILYFANKSDIKQE
jgi:hypothetical protein